MGSDSSCGSSLGPFCSNFASASKGERPRVRDVFRRCWVSSGVRREYAEVLAWIQLLDRSFRSQSCLACSLTAPENMGCGVPGLGLGRRLLDFGPLGMGRGVFGLDIISWP